MEITLLRNPYDFKTLKPDEIKLVHEYYKIDIGKDNCLSTSKALDKVKSQFYNDKDKLVEKYICFLRKTNQQ